MRIVSPRAILHSALNLRRRGDAASHAAASRQHRLAFDVLMQHFGAFRLHNGGIFGLALISAPGRTLWFGAEVGSRAARSTIEAASFTICSRAGAPPCATATALRRLHLRELTASQRVASCAVNSRRPLAPASLCLHESADASHRPPLRPIRGVQPESNPLVDA